MFANKTDCLGGSRKVSYVISLTVHGSSYISNKPSFHQQRPGVSHGVGGSDGALYPLRENPKRAIAHATGRIAFLPHCGNYTMPLILAKRGVVHYARQPAVRLPLL